MPELARIPVEKGIRERYAARSCSDEGVHPGAGRTFDVLRECQAEARRIIAGRGPAVEDVAYALDGSESGRLDESALQAIVWRHDG